MMNEFDKIAGAYHVQVEDCNFEAEVVLIEDSLKFMVQEGSTLREADPSPGIKGTSLELYRS